MSLIDTFLNALDGVGVTWSRTETDTFQSTVASVIEPPCVGVRLPFERVSLKGLDVTVDPSPSALAAAQSGVTPAHLGVAETGSLLLQSGPDATEAASLFPEQHVAVLRASDVVPNLAATFEQLGPLLRNRSASAILATGPSATADMGALVTGAHGPKYVHVVLVDDQ